MHFSSRRPNVSTFREILLLKSRLQTQIAPQRKYEGWEALGRDRFFRLTNLENSKCISIHSLQTVDLSSGERSESLEIKVCIFRELSPRLASTFHVPFCALDRGKAILQEKPIFPPNCSSFIYRCSWRSAVSDGLIEEKTGFGKTVSVLELKFVRKLLRNVLTGINCYINCWCNLLLYRTATTIGFCY